MAKEYQFNWRSKIPEQLLEGDVFDRFDDETSTLDLSCHVYFEESGFYIVWNPKGKDAGVLDLVQVWEARSSGTIKDARILYDLEQRGAKEPIEERTVWITYGQDLVNVNSLFLIAKTAQIAKEWRFLINELIRNYKFRHCNSMISLQKHWKFLCLSTNERGKIPLRNIIKTFSSGKPERMVHKCLTDLGLAGDKEREELDVGLFTFEKFLRLYHKICPRTEVQELFVKLSGQKEYLTRDRLINFLNEEQRDPRLNEILFPFFDHERVQQLIAKYETDESYISQGKMSGDGFLRFLMNDENSPVFLDRTELYQDMDQPLCHYYINSSHNTYLTGRQYGGKSSTEIYRQVLLSGCRCIELDCWDGNGENKGEPIITHGMAMCTDVFFKDVLYQIRDTAFARTDFPVILSFENHCCRSNQLKMAKYCMEIFGDMLLSQPLEDFPLEPGVPLPSPNRLRRKILIKNKRLKADIEKHQMEQFLREGKLDEEDEISETPEVIGMGEETAASPSDQRAHPEQDHLTPVQENVRPQIGELKIPDEAHPELKQTNFISKLKPLGFAKKQQPILTKEEEERIFAEYNYTGATTNIHPLLSTLVNYTHPVKFSGFEVAESNDLHFHMSSFSESTGLGYLKQSAPEFVNYNKRQLSRIYPKGARVDSSNFLPQIFWNAGCQMVSLNFQTPDVCMQLNQGKFDYNGQTGYLLKPDFMRRPDRTFDPFSESPVDGVIAAHCSVRVISGQFLSERKAGTYVEVEMYGLPTDTIRKEHRTRTVPANGLNPIYNEEPFVFRKVVLPELAVLRFAVYDESGKQIGQRILPLDGLQSGYRHISLRTESNMPMTLSTLFVHLVLKTYVPDELSGLVDALADPRAYLSAQEKRKEALHNMGVDDNDIVDIVPSSSPNSTNKKDLNKSNRQDAKQKANGASTPQQAPEARPSTTTSSPIVGGANGNQSARVASEVNPDNRYKSDPINLNDLRKEKSFVKLNKKFHKELDEMKKRHQKQRDAIQRQQQMTIDRMVGDSARDSKKKKKNASSNGSRHASLSNKDSDSQSGIQIDQRMRSLVTTQTDEWSALVKKQQQEEFEQRKCHIKEEFELLKKLLIDNQKVQITVLSKKYDEDMKNMRLNQTKKSMEDTKALQQDRNMSKAERDRRIRELNEKNVKLFMEERKRHHMKRERNIQQTVQKHIEQNEALEREFRQSLQQEEMNQQESILAAKPESVV